MTASDTRHALYYRPPGATSKRWALHDIYPTWDVAMSAALRLKAASAVWVTPFEPTSATSTELTPAAAKQRPARQPSLFEMGADA